MSIGVQKILLPKVDLKRMVMVGLPSVGHHSIDFSASLQNIAPPINHVIVWAYTKGLPVADARNILLDQAVKNGVKYLFFMDEDVISPQTSLAKLIRLMELNPNMSIVGGLYCSKGEPSQPLCFRANGEGSYWGFRVGDLFQVTGMGMGCTLIRMSHVARIPVPETYWPPSGVQYGVDAPIPRLFVTESQYEVNKDGGIAPKTGTEDLYFCKLAHEAGCEIWVDSSIQCVHLDERTGYYWQLPPGANWDKTAGELADKRVVDLGCSTNHIVVDGVPATRVDGDESCQPDYVCDLRMLPFENDYWGFINASHVLEHLPWVDLDATLREWVRTLKPGGTIRIVVPNAAHAAKKIIEEDDTDTFVQGLLYGDQGHGYFASNVRHPRPDESNIHMSCFTPKSLSLRLQKIGLEDIGGIDMGAMFEVTAKKPVAVALDVTRGQMTPVETAATEDGRDGHSEGGLKETLEIRGVPC